MRNARNDGWTKTEGRTDMRIETGTGMDSWTGAGMDTWMEAVDKGTDTRIKGRTSGLTRGQMTRRIDGEKGTN